MEYDREALVNVLVYHYRDSISHCGCGWNELGKSWPEHVANVYEMVLEVNKPYECPHLNTDEVIMGHPDVTQLVTICLDCNKEL